MLGKKDVLIADIQIASGENILGKQKIDLEKEHISLIKLWKYLKI